MGELGVVVLSASTLSVFWVPRGVGSNSSFSDIVSPMSRAPTNPRLGYASSLTRRMGLRRRGVVMGPPSGRAGWAVEVDMMTLPAVSTTGDECARVISGAERELLEEWERRWLREKGERLRGRNGSVASDGRGLEEGGVEVSVLRRGVEGRTTTRSVCSGWIGRGSFVDMAIGEIMGGGGEAARGDICAEMPTATAAVE